MNIRVKLLFSFFCILLSCRCYSQKNLQFRSNVQYPRILSNIWGYTDSLGREYALVGVETGLSIVDVTDPDHPNPLFYVPNDTSIWQEPKVWSHYAYVTNEHGGGLLIVNLGHLPDSVSYTRYTNTAAGYLVTAHTCFVDDSGFIYINGTSLGKELICDLKPDPMNPTYVGYYDDFYVHDCFARHDTLYTAEIQNGQFSITDVHHKTHPTAFVRQATPFAFSHNVWLSDDSRYLFNTDEKKFAPVTSYDISNTQNITELDKYRHSDYDSSVVHNTYYRDGFLYTSYYRDGVTIVDANKPDNMVEVGDFDTSPFPPAEGYEGCWGVYCFFPSGNIVCSDRQEGLFVLSPTLQRACYLEGRVTDQANNNPLSNIRVEIIGQPRYKTTDILGSYKTGVADSGLYDVRFTDFNTHCQTLIVGNVMLHSGIVTTLNEALSCQSLSGIGNLSESFSFNASPTVFNSITKVQFNSLAETATMVTLFDSEGRQLNRYHFETPNAELILGENLNAGIYFLRAEQDGVSKTLKLVKQ